nr:hypothetical protein [Streptomyces sp. F8]
MYSFVLLPYIRYSADAKKLCEDEVPWLRPVTDARPTAAAGS